MKWERIKLLLLTTNVCLSVLYFAIVRCDFCYCCCCCSWCLTKFDLRVFASVEISSREQLNEHWTPSSERSSTSTNGLLWFVRKKTVCKPRGNGKKKKKTTNGAQAAHQHRLNPDLYLAPRRPVNHCCSFQRGEWISSAPGIHRPILNCLADNFCIIAGC